MKRPVAERHGLRRDVVVKRRMAWLAYQSLHEWFGEVCHFTGHWHGCALMNVGPIQWAWRTFGIYGYYGLRGLGSRAESRR